MPIRSPRPIDRVRRGTATCLAAALSLFASAAGVRAHELGPGAAAGLGAPGWRLGGALAAVLPAADARWPSASWDGVLTTGSAPPDMRHGLRLEHATLESAARVDGAAGLSWTGTAVLGWHDRDGAHVEALGAAVERALGAGTARLALGRDTVPMGPLIDGAGHFDRYSQAPLAKRAAVDGDVIDDGLMLGWRADDTHAEGLRGATLGLWRGAAFPGGPGGPLAPSFHLQGGWGDLDLHLAGLHVEPEGRGAAARSLDTVGHVHGAPDCRRSIAQLVCFDGRADVLGASLAWAPDDGPWSASVAGLWREDRGTLYSTNGAAAARLRSRGVWADLAWQPDERWTVATRAERLVPEARLDGTGTAVLAREAGLADAAVVHRLTTAVLYRWQHGLQFALEAGHERQAEQRVSHLALRLLWREPRWLGGSW